MNTNTDSSKDTIWTRQNIKSLDDLKSNGVYRVKRQYIEEQFRDIAPFYINLYKWFVHAARSRVYIPEGIEFPIWCSVSREGMLSPIENTIAYELEVDKSDIIYFDGNKWDHVLNHWYIPRDKKDAEAYAERMRLLGLQETTSFIEGKYANFYPMEKKIVLDSWYRIFDIDNWNIYTTQANIWEIRPDMIKNIYYYNK
ncbi:DUF3841 domain-containing protein [Sedimentibacter hydroxybenzoicus DSM 7310]|uniref:DUF3841 domain-containing protein n=1 Tax=Sedimentibacter hydroxybenzoicus DSM 7310 TaxID=1123245 RepID=A0A974BN36_SEDHY|nr:DUF3841 domain-containing protein [Sedimentibacter hydroxybenzoicus]NYB75916.1 DUF3841 domain-containing protein [Sedimentibacter hydroxybenzoicus DSM 7310]